MLPRVDHNHLLLRWRWWWWWWWCLQFLELQPLGTELLLHRLAGKLLLPQLIVLLLTLCFGEHGLLPLRSCRHLWLQRLCFQGLLLSPSRLFDASVDATHRRDVFSWPSARASTEMPSLVVLFVCVAATSPCEGVVVVVVAVSSEVAPVVPLFFIAAMWCIEPTGGRQTVGGECLWDGRTLQQ